MYAYYGLIEELPTGAQAQTMVFGSRWTEGSFETEIVSY